MAIKPAVDASRNETDEKEVLNKSINNNIENIVDQLKMEDPILSKLVEESNLTIAGACYYMDSGNVEILQ